VHEHAAQAPFDGLDAAGDRRGRNTERFPRRKETPFPMHGQQEAKIVPRRWTALHTSMILLHHGDGAERWLLALAHPG
jgi:hypothetical protein